MKKFTSVATLILAVVMVFSLAACGKSNSSTAAVGQDHMLAGAVSDKLDVPTDRLYGIITYGGEDHLLIAEEHKEADHYGIEYIDTYIDTDGIDWYESEPVYLYFECPVCGSHCHDTIPVGAKSPGRIFWCECENPWVIGVTIAKEEVGISR